VIIAIAVFAAATTFLYFSAEDSSPQALSDALFIVSIFFTLAGLMVILTAHSRRKYYEYLKAQAHPSAKDEQIEKEFRESIDKREMYTRWGITVLIPGIAGLIASGILIAF